jgi:hypothetical protein
MSQGAKSGEYGGWGMPAIYCFVSSCWVRTEVWDGALSRWSCETVHSQFFRQNPLACPITNSNPLSNVVNGLTSILTEELLNSCRSLRSCAACGSPCVLPVLNRTCHWNTTQDLVPDCLLNDCEGLCSTFPKMAQNLMHTRCSFLWSSVKIDTGHVQDSKWTRVKTAHVHSATWNMAHWLTRHGSPTICWCFALPQLMCRLRRQSGIFSIPPRIVKCGVFLKIECFMNIKSITKWKHSNIFFVLYIIYSVYCQLIYSPLAEVVTRGIINTLNDIIYSKKVVYSKWRELIQCVSCPDWLLSNSYQCY